MQQHFTAAIPPVNTALQRKERDMIESDHGTYTNAHAILEEERRSLPLYLDNITKRSLDLDIFVDTIAKVIEEKAYNMEEAIRLNQNPQPTPL